MAAERQSPFALAICNAIIRMAAQMVPLAQQRDWEREWLAEIWHRWQLLRCTGNWNSLEALRLVRTSLGSFIDGGWHLFSEHIASSRLQEGTRSPWVCIGMLSGLLAMVGLASGGFAATRQLFFGGQPSSANLVFVWQHPVAGGGDQGLPPDAAPDWAKHSRLLQGAAGFTTRYALVRGETSWAARELIVTTEPGLFAIFGVRPAMGEIPCQSRTTAPNACALAESAAVLDQRTWRSVFHSDAHVVGSRVTVGNASYRVGAVLPASFHFLSRQPSLFVVEPRLLDPSVMVVARAKPGVMASELTRELTDISEIVSYYFFRSDLRIEFMHSAVETPLRFFAIAVLIAALLVLAVARYRMRTLRLAWQPKYRAATLRRTGFLLGKTALALLFVFTAGLEWSRSEASLLFASRDPASGPFLVWLYILGAMGVLFWSFADQRARCRVCLRLLCFPVRIGCPGCLLLDWSGTELLCSEGHGVLHVPHLAASWEDEAEHWITLDDSWQELFAETK
jgi:MacB-like periplasmic core domain